MQAQVDQIRARCREVFARAHELYPHLNFDRVTIRFDLRGRAAGMAGYRGNQYFMRFNADMLSREAFDHVINNTVPHEIAHIVCFMDPRLGRNHDHGWARVCRALGGTGARTHSQEVVYGKGNTYEYTTDCGHQVRVGDRHHKYLQAGGTLRLRNGKGTITSQSAYSIVGVKGRTLAAPIQKVAPVAQQAPTVPNTVKVTVRDPFGLLSPATVQKPAVAPAIVPVQRATAGESKASVSRRIMLSGYRAGHSYEQIISAMIAANGYDRQLARATFKANQAKVGIPVTFG